MSRKNGRRSNTSNTKEFSEAVRNIEKETTIEIDDEVAFRGFKVSDVLKPAFKGFEKVPTVFLNPIDITPYLKRKKRTPGEKSFTAVQCSVNIARVDLEKLAEAFKRSPDAAMDSYKAVLFNLKCNICEKVYSCEKKLQLHLDTKHMVVYKPQTVKPKKKVSFSDTVIVHNVVEYHSCRKCTKIFDSYKLLKNHMKIEHKKRKCYVCHYCSKKFVDRMFFKVHIKLHCDVCTQLLPNKSKYNDHRRYVCRVIKFHKCKECEESFFRLIDLKDHSYDHNTDSKYICDICKDQCPSKCSLGHHISFLHSNERPTVLYEMRSLGSERLYLCKFCEVSSVDRTLIENHVKLLPDLSNRAITGRKDYYFCDQCMKTFNTESDMLQHKWTHYLKMCGNVQERPKRVTTPKKDIKTIFKINEGIPDYMKPKVILEKIKIGGKVVTDDLAFVDVKSFDVTQGEIKKPVVDPKSKKTLISKHQCLNCGKYYSSNYSLNRHIETQHTDYENLRCKMCEETFVWPSLLQSHKCIRLKLPEMPFEDARPEIHFDNLHDLNITESQEFVDFEIPEPIVELKESGGLENSFLNGCAYNGQVNGEYAPLQKNVNYKVIMQEVPIEF